MVFAPQAAEKSGICAAGGENSGICAAGGGNLGICAAGGENQGTCTAGGEIWVFAPQAAIFWVFAPQAAEIWVFAPQALGILVLYIIIISFSSSRAYLPSRAGGDHHLVSILKSVESMVVIKELAPILEKSRRVVEKLGRLTEKKLAASGAKSGTSTR